MQLLLPAHKMGQIGLGAIATIGSVTVYNVIRKEMDPSEHHLEEGFTQDGGAGLYHVKGE